MSPNVLMALHKEVGLQPIGMGTSFKQNMNKHGTMAVRERAAKHMLPHQFAIGIPGGMDYMIHMLQYELGESVHPELPLHLRRALLKLDFVNMFNSVSRDATRAELVEAFPELVVLLDEYYPPEGNEVWIQLADGTWTKILQEEGFAQGDPFAPLFSCLPLQRLLRGLHEQLRLRHLARISPHCHSPKQSYPTAFMDDTLATSHLADVRSIFEYPAEHGPPLGLNLHKAKCEILLSTNGDPRLAPLPPTLQADLRCAADTSVSYTHLTLPTKRILWISQYHGSIEQN